MSDKEEMSEYMHEQSKDEKTKGPRYEERSFMLDKYYENDLYQRSLTKNMDEVAIRERLYEFDMLCRSYGAYDIIDLFLIKMKNELLFETFTQDETECLIIKLINFINEENFIRGFGSEYGSTALALLATPNADLNNWLQNIKRFFQGFTLIDICTSEIYIPVFCAHPIKGITGVTYRVSIERTETSKVGFSIKVPGISGGLGMYSSIRTTIGGKNLSTSYQLQAKVNVIVRKWMNNNQEVITCTPVKIIEIQQVDSSRSQYIGYDDTQKTHQLDVPNNVLIDSPEPIETEIINGSEDVFDVSLNQNLFGVIMGVQLKIESRVEDRFLVVHDIVANHRYVKYGYSKNCHDIRINAQQLP